MAALLDRYREEGTTAHEIVMQLHRSSAPIDVFAILTALDIWTSFVSEPGWECACGFDRIAQIWIRKESPLVRQRLSAAHSLGHLLMHPKGQTYRDAAPGMETSATERQANEFAFALLMPKVKLAPLMYNSELSIDQLATMFAVSPQAMGIRVQQILNGATSDVSRTGDF